MAKKKRHIIEGVAAVALLIVCVITFGVIWSTKGHTTGAVRTVGSSEKFTEAELNDAIDALCARFETDFRGCTLKAVRYDEERSKASNPGGFREGHSIILLTDFYAPHFFGPSTTTSLGGGHKDYEWKLHKNDFDWEVDSWGYA